MKLFKERKADQIEETVNSVVAPLFTEYLDTTSKSLSYLNESENAAVDEAVALFESEYGNDLSKLDEGFFGRILGGIGGFLAGPSVGKILANVLGIEKGVVYDLLTSRLVGIALGSALAKAMEKDKK